MAQSFIMIIALIMLGYILKKLKYLKEDGSVLAVLVMNLTLSSFVIVNLSGVEIDASLIMLPIIMIIYAVIAKFLAILLFLKYNNQIRGSVGMMASAFNIGLFAYPLVEQMFGVTYFVGSYFSEGGEV